MYPIKTPFLFPFLFPSCTWRIRNSEAVHLTFDDGPVPGVTDQVLDLLQNHGVKATFFCIGQQVRQHPDLVKRILQEGHTLGSHTMNHVSGWSYSLPHYVEEVEQGNALISSNLFRPPYGRLTAAQYRHLTRRYRVVMWDVLSGDFDTRQTAHTIRQRVRQFAKPGSIVVFHDSQKAAPRLLPALPYILEDLQHKSLPTAAIT